MPHYKKAFDIGTYTGNGGQYRVGIPTLRSVGPTGTQIVGSLRFRSSNTNHLYRTPASNTSSNKKVTFSCWIKIGSLSSSTNNGTFLGAADNYHYGQFYSNTLYFGNVSYYLNTTAKFIDPSIWYHVFFVADSTLATTNDRMQIWVNGTRQAAGSFNTQPTLNASFEFFNTTQQYIIGKRNTGSEFDGYLSQVYFVDGQALTPSSFGEYNSDGIWVPKAYSGTYGTNGFYLPMNSSSNHATDQSGNGNNFTPSGFNVTTANTTYDIMTDSPTDYLSGSMSTANNAGNYATFSSLNKSSRITLSNGNLTAAKDSFVDWNSVLGPYTFSSGKWYYEFTLGTTTNKYFIPGYVKTNFDWSINSNYPGQATGSYGLDCTSGNKRTGDVSSSYGSGFVSNDVAQVALDLDNGKIWWGKNGTWFASGDPAAGTNAAYTGLTGPLIPALGMYTSETGTINFGQRPFAYTPPTGFAAINTYNYSRPADSSLWFYGDTPDLMWMKNRSTTANNVVTDTVRGVGLNLVTNARAPDLSYPAVSEMNKFGMSIINDSVSIVNGSGNSHVYWTWKANGSSTVTDTSGTITSQVSSNRQAGFSIVSWVYNSSGGTIGHGLGAAPSFIIQRSRTAGYNWDVYHVSIGATKRLTLNTTSASETYTGPWNDTAPTSSVFSSGASWWTNGDNMISYLWTAIPGYSAFGSYTGNGSADGPFVYLGFRPKWIMIKVTSAIDHWILYDTVRSDYNPADDRLFANLTNAESASDNIDILSNGFKLRSSTTINNTSSGTYIYAAFAEIPFKFARGR